MTDIAMNAITKLTIAGALSAGDDGDFAPKKQRTRNNRTATGGPPGT